MERIENHGDEQLAGPSGAEVVRLWPINVLVISPDRCFRSTVAMLIGRRDRPALTAEGEREALELAAGERIDVLVLERPPAEPRRGWDAYVQSLASSIGLAMARQGHRVAPVGVVVVSESPSGIVRTGSPQSLELDKWGAFEELFGAIVRADRARRLPRERRHLPWPASLRAARAD
ncbi:MAG TPA: hypothetical protein VNV44_02110 [Solirubrobacteraceae bacterium]|jgi:hypothetical protein|nr:hypothetical protein [Solirubrobacteraceae bacterium]